MAFPKPQETAVLTVNGRDFTDWESITVRCAKRDVPPYHCRFTCSEGMPIAKNFAVMQIKPGDKCTVTLAGQPAFAGRVETRQVYYDASRHHIEIQCATNVEIATASVISKTGEWIDKTFQQIAEPLLAKLGVKLTFEGGAPPSYKFPRVSATPGESVYDFLDMLARSLNGIAFTSNVKGDFVVIMGPNGETDSVTEGENIIIGREVIFNPAMSGVKPAISQAAGSDAKWGAGVASVPFFQQDDSSIFTGSAPSVIISELPTSDNKMLQGRATSEGHWQAGDQITVHATVAGWLRPSGGLWTRNQTVNVNSPMLMMNGDALRAVAVTFSQDNKTGTRTTLELQNDAASGGQSPAIR